MLGSQARPAQADRPAGAGGGAASDEVQALLVDIFARTGQKVEIDDPLVAAALIHSALLQRAGNDAAQAIEKAAQNASRDIEAGQRCAAELRHAIGWLAPWHAKAALGAVLFAICFLASALGSLLAASACR